MKASLIQESADATLAIHGAHHVVTLNHRPLSLTRKEFELLVQLASEPDRVFTKAELLRSVWGRQSRGASRTVDSHAFRLRRKLGGLWVQNVWGVGYRLRGHSDQNVVLERPSSIYAPSPQEISAGVEIVHRHLGVSDSFAGAFETRTLVDEILRAAHRARTPENGGERHED